MIKKFRTIGKFTYVLYILFLLYFLIFSDWYGRGGMYEDYHYNFVPFQEILRYWNYRDQLGIVAFSNIAGNVLAFVPYGFLAAMSSRNRNFLRTSLDGFLLSLMVESFQLLAMVGSFDVDDLILNTFGAMSGYVGFVFCNEIRRIYDKNKKRA